MTTRTTALRMASARIEALETRSMFSGEIDHAFGTDGLTIVPTAGINYTTLSRPVEAVQADGKIVVVGANKLKSSTAVVARYLANGQPDYSFGTDGTVNIANVNASQIDAVTVLAGGQILVQGQTYFRLTSSGALDTTFGGGDGIATSQLAGDRRADAVGVNAVFADGSYLELQKALNGQARLFKYKADGSVDKTFGSSGSYNMANLDTGTPDQFEIGGVTIDSSGRIYVSYEVENNDGSLGIKVSRLTSAGKLDTSYGVNGVATNTDEYADVLGGIGVLTDGRVLITDSYRTDDIPGNGVLGFSADGKSDLYFDTSAGIFFPTQIIPAKDGSVYIGGTSGDSRHDYETAGNLYASVLHLTSSLAIDTQFTPDHDGLAGYRIVDNTSYAGAVLTKAGDIVVLGASSANQTSLVQFDGASRTTQMSYTFSNGKLVINGSSGDDRVTATNVVADPDEYYNPFADGTLLVHFDDNGTLTSRDLFSFEPGQETQVMQLVINLNSGNDTFDGRGLTHGVYVNGGNGDDLIYGGSAKDSLYGGAGNDTLVGGGGGGDVVVQ